MGFYLVSSVRELNPTRNHQFQCFELQPSPYYKAVQVKSTGVLRGGYCSTVDSYCNDRTCSPQFITCQEASKLLYQTLWFMQAALQDLAPTQHQTQSFVICQRVLHKCHEIIFGDLPPPATLPYAFLDLPFQARFTRKKVRANAEPALVGIGMVLAGAPAMPQLTQIMGEVAIEQGRVHAAGHEPPRAANDEDDATGPGMITPNTQLSDEDDAADLDEDSQDDTPTSATRPKLPQILTATDAGAPQPQGISLTRRKTIGAAKTSPALPLHMRTPRKPRLSDDPLGQNDPQPLPSNAASSSPSISSTPKHMSMSGADFLLQKYDLQAQSHLLRSYFCRSEVSRWS